MSSADRRHETAECEYRQTEVNDRLAAVTVRQPAERDLQYRLRETVGAERDADQRQVVAALEVLGVYREHRQDHEHAQHAQAENAGETRCSRAIRRRSFCWRVTS